MFHLIEAHLHCFSLEPKIKSFNCSDIGRLFSSLMPLLYICIIGQCDFSIDALNALFSPQFWLKSYLQMLKLSIVINSFIYALDLAFESLFEKLLCLHSWFVKMHEILTEYGPKKLLLTRFLKSDLQGVTVK